MKVEINHDACIGCGMCNYINPENFDFDGDGYIEVKSENVTAKTKDAATNCPVDAIIIKEENDKI